MIKPPSKLPVADNSGALVGGCINISNFDRRVGALPSSILTISVKESLFKKNIKKKSRIINKSQIVKALLVTTVKGIKRKGNFFLRSSSNNIVLLNQYELPYGTRLFGPVFQEVRKKIRFRKVVSLAKTLV
jgi:large subunit ribosomal protein L14